MGQVLHGPRAVHLSNEYDTNYQLPNGPVKAERRWGQRHPQGANLGSNGILKFLSKTDTMADRYYPRRKGPCQGQCTRRPMECHKWLSLQLGDAKGGQLLEAATRIVKGKITNKFVFNW